MSANRAVTVLRSPSIALPAGGSGVIRTVEPACPATGGRFAAPAPDPAPSGAAHSPQNLNAGGLSNPQRAHRLMSAAPQLPQNFIP